MDTSIFILEIFYSTVQQNKGLTQSLLGLHMTCNLDDSRGNCQSMNHCICLSRLWEGDYGMHSDIVPSFTA